jgi:hypothetical protein
MSSGQPLKLLAVLTLLAFPAANVMAIEQPDYVVVYESDEYEIRRYEAYNVAQTVVDGDFRSSGGRAFRILAGYIFGDNRESEKMQMTAPVESLPVDEGVRMNMTAPVESSQAVQRDGYVYRFVMERKYDFDELPQPVDSRVELRRVPARVMAVHRYSGFWSESNYEKNERALLEALRADGIDVIGAPLLARYNGPFTPFFLRRNEVMVEVNWRGQETEAGD